MKREMPLLFVALAAVAAYGCARAEAQTVKAEGERGRGPIELIVYSGNFAMVRETRKVDLPEGKSRVGLLDVSKSLDQNSVLFSWPHTKDATVLSSTYDLGMSSSGRLLERFLGKEVELVYRGNDGRAGERTRGILEVAEPGNIVVRAEGKYIVNPEATIEAPTDTGIVTIPQLSAEVESKGGGAAELGVAYMTEGLSWGADYTFTLQPNADALDMECWATVTNKTGTDFPDAKLSFVAGSPNRAVRYRGEAAKESQMEPEMRAGASPVRADANFVQAQAMGELYAYPYKSTATIRQDQMNRVRMMGRDTVSVKKVYSVALPAVYRDYAEFGNPDRRLTATMGINFTNSSDAGLGLPLPAGAVRVYEPDAKGAVHYVGAASINDTPKDAKISLELTNVFDVYARSRQLSARKIDKRHTSRTVEVIVSNEKAKPVEVRLVQNLGPNWKMAGETAKGRRLNSYSNEWKVLVPAGGEKKLRYTVVLGP